MSKKSKQILERKKKAKSPFILNEIQEGDYIICIDDESKSKTGENLIPITDEEKKFYGSFVNVFTGESVKSRDYKWENSYKLKTITIDKLYKVLKIKDRKNYKENIQIIGDKNVKIWISPNRFDFDPEMSKNKNRFEKLKTILDNG